VLEKPAIDPWTLPPAQALPYWPLGINFDMHVYLTTSERPFDVFMEGTSGISDNDLPHFVWSNITYGNYKEHRVIDFDVKFPQVS